ncbi:hypothetical protein [Paenibacillus wynnii]|uniref:Uncharacterized protein n=1 Tax=Paenibacillus wynnii TaxID=268407 RepID=A0A098MDL8_9BACL|nr:hypothetical protein [Paenibacillus wynnii]KGE18450.1 hypothetical protein PWYN_28570 [Paenibacillus wynnii]KGE20660.1 hypothetical protein PWYN_00195 [Paenibacillus wynnii]
MRFVGIDPATQTGFVALDEDGRPLVEVELVGKGRKEKGGITTQQLVSLENQLYQLLKPGDIIAIEQPAMGTQSGVTTGMIHGGLRSMIYRKGLTYVDVNPQRTKKYVNENRRLAEDDDKKAIIATAVLEHYNYSHSSHNVTDAYIIAKIAEAVQRVKNGQSLESYTPYQQDVIQAIISPAAKTTKKKKDKSVPSKRRGKPAAADSHMPETERQFLF